MDWEAKDSYHIVIKKTKKFIQYMRMASMRSTRLVSLKLERAEQESFYISFPSSLPITSYTPPSI